MALFAIALILGLLIATRSVYRALDFSVNSRDVMAHLLFTEDIADEGHRLPDKPSSVATSGVYAYPFLVHWALSFLPSRVRLEIARYFPALMDLGYGLGLLLLVPLEVLTTSQATFALLLFTVTPEFIRPNRSDGISLSARKPGLILTTSAVLTFSLWIKSGDPVYLGTSILLAALTMLTSKFSVQALFFIMVPLAYLDPLAVGVLIGGFAVAVVVSGGTYWRVFTGHVGHLHEYATQQKFKMSYTDSGTGIKERLATIERPYDAIEFAYKSDVIQSFVFNPFVVPVVLAYALTLMGGPDIQLPPWTHYWILGSLGAFALTTLPYFKFIGQADRYLQYGFLPMAVLIASGLSTFGLLFRTAVGVTVALSVAVIGASVYAYVNMFSTGSEDPDFDEAVSFFDQQPLGTVLVQPFWRARELAWKTDHVVVDFVMNGGSTQEVIEERDALCPSQYGFVTGDVDWLAEQYDADWVLFDTSRLDKLEDTDLHPPHTQPEFSNDTFTIYRFTSVKDDDRRK